jgi:hypothetical protein
MVDAIQNSISAYRHTPIVRCWARANSESDRNICGFVGIAPLEDGVLGMVGVESRRRGKNGSRTGGTRTAAA